MLYLLLSIAFLACSVHSQYNFACEENYCKKKGNECPELNCKDGRIVKNATMCGCCDICIGSLGEGESCPTTEYGWSQRFKECGSGLICDKSGKCVATECLKKVDKYDEKYKNAKIHLKPSFHCDHFGNYEPVVCISDVLCFCVDKKGKRIFGTDFADNKKSMHCNCSRDIRDFPKEVDDDHLPRCLSNGNYDSLQCTEDKCFCMESSNPFEEDADNGASSIKKLSCYNSALHENGRITKCLKERGEQMKHFKNRNITVIGVDLIRCDLDGSYYPVQCKNGRCFCVNRNGKIYENYETAKMKTEMTCRCLRDKEIMKDRNEKTENMAYFEDLECDGFGNYKSKSTTVILESFFDDFMKE